MSKRIISALIVILILSFVGCEKEMKTLHCDGCGIAVEVEANSNMEEDWIIYCSDCEKEKGLDTIIVED